MSQKVETVSVLWRMARPTHLLLIAFVYLLGAMMALAQGEAFDGLLLLFGLLVLMMVSMSVHYANEYADYETDALTRRTLFSGGSGALPKSSQPRSLALRAAWVVLLAGSVLALLGWAAGALNTTALFVLAIGTFLGWMYSLPPMALAWRGWGELDNAVAGGMALPLFGFAALAGAIDLPVAAGCLPFVALVFLNLLATTWPDRQADSSVGKRMLATRWSPARLRRVYWAVAALFFLMFPILVGWSLPPRVAWSSYLVAPLVILGGLLYTRVRTPFPSVAAMVAMAVVQFVAWSSLAAV
ncbi:MAG: prenyltransferase [Anaerolineales bacterium]